MRPLTASDIQDDEAWRFAPVAVISGLERDVINLEQADAFARAFGQALIKWPLDVVDDAVVDKELLRQLQSVEPQLWACFVEGKSSLRPAGSACAASHVRLVPLAPQVHLSTSPRTSSRCES